MFAYQIFYVSEKKWWEYIRDGEFELSCAFLVGADPSFPTYKRPVVRSFQSHILRHAPDLTPKGGYTPPLQPIVFIVESDKPPEDFVKEWVDTFTGSGGLRLNAIKLRERFAYSPSSSLHGAMLQKIQYQRNQAKELLATIQNIKTAIINIESDLEKLGEQIAGFRSGDWGQIKGIFVDNYGGPDRSWTAAARHVPIVRLALTWFLRLGVPEEVPLKDLFSIKVKKSEDRKKLEEIKKKVKEACEKNKKAMKKEVDKLVEEEKMNPALGNYLKRKLEEFWNWVASYSIWLKTTYDRIEENLIQQKANLKMYMKWAADAIKNAENITTNPEEFEYGDFVGYFKKFTPSEAMSSEYVFAADSSKRPEIFDRTKPYVPVILCNIQVFQRVEVQNRLCDVVFVIWHGYMHINDYEMLKELAGKGARNLIDVMMKAGAITKEEAEKIFTEEELKELELVPPKIEKGTKEKMVELWENFVNLVSAFMRVFGFELPKESLPWIRTIRAASHAFTLVIEGIRRYKESYGMLQLPL